MVNAKVELAATMIYTDIEKSNTGFNVSTQYHVTKHIAVGAGYTFADGADIKATAVIIFY